MQPSTAGVKSICCRCNGGTKATASSIFGAAFLLFYPLLFLIFFPSFLKKLLPWRRKIVCWILHLPLSENHSLTTHTIRCVPSRHTIAMLPSRSDNRRALKKERGGSVHMKVSKWTINLFTSFTSPSVHNKATCTDIDALVLAIFFGTFNCITTHLFSTSPTILPAVQLLRSQTPYTYSWIIAGAECHLPETVVWPP